MFLNGHGSTDILPVFQT